MEREESVQATDGDSLIEATLFCFVSKIISVANGDAEIEVSGISIHVRVSLQQLVDFSYTCKDEDVLKETEERINSVLTFALSKTRKWFYSW